MLRIRSSLASLAVHAGLLLLVFGVMRLRSVEVAVPVPARPHANVVWLANPNIGGGGGGGGDHTPLSRKTTPQPVATPRPQPADVEPMTQPTIEAIPLNAEPTLAGVIEPVSTTATTQGPGAGGGADSGTGTGSGPGRGPGLGDGHGGNTGGDGYRVGNGVSAPKLVLAVKPQYTPDAMRAHISGSVWLECVVDSRGRVDRCRLSRSLDKNFGLDEEAIKAARQWKFEPGVRSGEPVPVQVTIELAFSLR